MYDRRSPQSIPPGLAENAGPGSSVATASRTHLQLTPERLFENHLGPRWHAPPLPRNSRRLQAPAASRAALLVSSRPFELKQKASAASTRRPCGQITLGPKTLRSGPQQCVDRSKAPPTLRVRTKSRRRRSEEEEQAGRHREQTNTTPHGVCGERALGLGVRSLGGCPGPDFSGNGF